MSERDEEVCTGQCGYSDMCRQCERDKRAALLEEERISEMEKEAKKPAMADCR